MAKAWYFYDTNGNRRKVKQPYFYDTNGNRRKVTKGFFYDTAGNRHQFFSSAPAATTFDMQAELGPSPIVGYRYFQYGYCVPDMPRVRDNGAVIQITSASGVVTLIISGIGGEMVTQGNVFTTFNLGQQAGFYTLGSANAVFTPSGSAGNSTGQWVWNIGLDFTEGTYYNGMILA